MTRRLVLHIGAHKTGTTTLQRVLDSNRAVLAEDGIGYATAGDEAHLHGFLRFDPAQPIARGFRPDAGALAGLFAATPGDLVIGSSENLSFVFDPTQVQALAMALRPLFGEIRIFSYLRRQDRHLVSHHEEGAKGFRDPEALLWGHAPRALPAWRPEHDLYLDYHARLAPWAKAFGTEAMVLRVFHPAELLGDDVVADFSALAGIDAARLRLLPKMNTSIGRLQAKLGHLMNGLGFPPDEVDAMLAALPVTARQRPSRAEAEACVARYRASNAQLAECYGITFDDDFSDYPEAADEDWTEATANEALLAVLRRLRGL